MVAAPVAAPALGERGEGRKRGEPDGDGFEYGQALSRRPGGVPLNLTHWMDEALDMAVALVVAEPMGVNNGTGTAQIAAVLAVAIFDQFPPFGQQGKSSIVLGHWRRYPFFGDRSR